MSDLPVEIDDLAIKVKKGQRPPRSLPVEGTKSGRKFLYTMRVGKPLRQQKKVTGLCRHSANRDTKKGVSSPKDQGRSGCGKCTTKLPPGEHQRLVEGWKVTRTERKRSRENTSWKSTETQVEPEGHKRNPPRTGGSKTLDPLGQKRQDFQFDVDNRKTTKKGGD